MPSSSNGWFSPVPAADRSQPNISPLPLSSSHAELSFKNGKVRLRYHRCTATTALNLCISCYTQVYIKDLDSAFGTFVNGSRISGETQLNSGDILVRVLAFFNIPYFLSSSSHVFFELPFYSIPSNS